MMGAWATARAFGRTLFSSSQGAAAVAQTTVARFAIVALNVFTGIITARSLGTVGRGEMAAMMLWPGLLSYLFTFGLPTAIRYWTRRKPGREAEFLTASLIVATLSSIFCGSIGVLFIPTWLHNYSPDVIRMAQFLMLCCPEMTIAVMMASMMEALGKFSLSNISRYVPVVLTLASLIVLALTHTLTPFTAALSYTVPPSLIAVWTYWQLRSFIILRPFNPLPALRLLGSYGIRAYGIDVLTTLSTQIDQVLVVGILSAGNVGVYGVALNASRVVNVLHAAVTTVLFPSAAGLSKPEILTIVARSARISTVIAAVFGGTLCMFYPLLIPLMYGGSFSMSIEIARLLTLEAVLLGLVLVLGQAFMALERPAFITTLQFVGLSIVLPAMLVLLPRFGLIGAAMALLFSTTVRLILILLAYPLLLHARLPNLIPTADDVIRVRQALIRS